MANVYFVKMKDPNQVEKCEFIDPTPENFPALQQGDLCFVRFEGESTPSALKRLWNSIWAICRAKKTGTTCRMF